MDITITKAAEFFELVAKNKFSEAGKAIGLDVQGMPVAEGLRIVRERQTELLDEFQSGEGSEQIVVDLNGWTMGDYEEYATSLQEGDFENASELVSRIVKEWPHSGKPTTVSNYMKLALKEFGAVVAAVNAAMGRIFLA